MTFGQLVRQTFDLLFGDLAVVLIAMVAMTVVSTLADISASPVAAFIGLPWLVVQFAMTRRLVDRQGLRVADRRAGFGSFFLVGLLTGLGSLLGLVCLVLPGIYLAARWSMSDAVLFAENEGSGNAIGRSWAATNGHMIPITLAMILFYSPAIVISATGFLVGFGAQQSGQAGQALDPSVLYGVDAATNLFTTMSQVAGWYFGVAVYVLLVGRPESALEEVFA
ncbi:MAG: hypothetical protein V4459_05375 [Pseudomonadota bacterium]